MLDLLLLDVSGYSYLPPLGLLYIATYAEARGFKAGLLGLSGQNLTGRKGAFTREYLKYLLQIHQPKVIGLPVYAESEHDVARICRRIRQYSSARILVGGPQATAEPLHVMALTGADALVTGDGEERTVQVLEAWRSASVPSEMGGILFRHHHEILSGGLPGPQADLEQLPFPDYSLVLGPDSGVRSLVTGRGCPFQCTFCFEGSSQKFRVRTLNSVLNELEQLLSASSIKMLAFFDDTLTLDKERVKAICGVIKDRFTGPWFCEGRVEVLYRDREIIEMLADAGCSRLQVGLESGSEGVLKAYGKNTTPDQIKQVFRWAYEAGITSVIGNFIVGGAFEDHDTFRDTLQLAKDLIELGPGSSELLSCYLFPYTGTAIQRAPQDFDLEFLEDYHLYNAAGRSVCINRTRNLTRGEITQNKMFLDAMIQSYMLDKIDSLAPDKIENHLKFARDNDIFSEWYHVMLQCKPLSFYAQFLCNLKRKTWNEIADRADWLAWCPTRVGGDSCRVEGDALELTVRRNRTIRLSGIDKSLYELSSGKLSLEEMLAFLQGRTHASHRDTSALIDELRQSNVRLADDFVLVYSEL